MGDAYRVAVVQSQIRHVGDLEMRDRVVRENINRIRSLIEYTGIRWGDTKLVLLPEWSLTGSDHNRTVEEWAQIAIRIPGPEIELLGAVAREMGVYLGGGTMEYDPEWPGRYFNSAYLLDPSGELILRYRKMNGAPQQGQNNYSTPPDLIKAYLDRYGLEGAFPVVDTPIGVLGMQVCYDINFPEISRILGLQGAEVILHPTGEPHAPHRAAWEMGRRTRAYENKCYVISANHGSYISPVNDQVFSDSPFPLFQEQSSAEIAPMFRSGGGSEIVDYEGEVIAGIHHPGEAVIQGQVDLAALRQARAQDAGPLDPRVSAAAASLYDQVDAFPENHWLDRPLTDPHEGRGVTATVIDRFVAEGIFS